MWTSSYVGYLNYIIILFLTSGLFTLLVDLSHYKKDGKMTRERKAAVFTGWMNVVLGIVALVGSWYYKRYIW
ncbi:CLC_0170 family protein [Paenibacillus hodogayensis]|uniref:CLC_0170 family protein n=1 Tax=Paenibacillus hodogayensis TaxID=279208 RepID=A0ABV5VWE7_9BACL